MAAWTDPGFNAGSRATVSYGRSPDVSQGRQLANKQILDVLEIIGMIQTRVETISTVEDVPLVKPIVQLVIQAKQALQVYERINPNESEYVPKVFPPNPNTSITQLRAMLDRSIWQIKAGMHAAIKLLLQEQNVVEVSTLGVVITSVWKSLEPYRSTVRLEEERRAALVAQLQAQLAKLKDELAYLTTLKEKQSEIHLVEVTALKRQISELEVALQNAAQPEELLRLRQIADKQKSELNNLNDELRRRQEALAQAEAESAKRQRQVEALQAELASTKAALSDDAKARGLLAEAEKRLADTERIRSALDKEVTALKELLLKKDEELLARNSDFGKASDEVKYLLKSYEDMQVQLASSKKKNIDQSRKIKELMLKLPFYAEKQVIDTPPPTGIVFFVATDIEGSASMWSLHPSAMAATLPKHHTLIRACCAAHEGLEVRNEGTSFLFVFRSLERALGFCFKLQLDALQATWPPEIQELRKHKSAQTETASDGSVAFNGLRIQMGLHMGEGKFVKDPTTGWLSYVGLPILVLEKIYKAAWGGQILVSEETHEMIAQNASLCNDAAITPRVGQVSVEIDGKLQHYQIGQVLPTSLASKRKFPPPLSEAEQLGRQAERITEELTALKTENDALKSQLKGMEEKAAEANRRAQEMQRALDAAKTEQRRTQREALQRFMDEMKAMQDAQRDLEQRLQAANDKHSELNDYVRALNDQLREVSQNLQKLNKQHRLLQKEHNTCGPTIADLNKLIEDLKRKLEAMRSQSLRMKPITAEEPDGRETIWGNFQHKSGKQLGLKLKTEFGVNIFREDAKLDDIVKSPGRPADLKGIPTILSGENPQQQQQQQQEGK